MQQNRTESEIEANFIYHFAAPEEGGDKSIDEIIDALPPADEEGDEKDKIDPSAPEGSEATLPTMDSDMTEAQAIKDLIPWDNIIIKDDMHYAETLMKKGLPKEKAKAKSFFLCFETETEIKRIEGTLNKHYIGGYGTKEKLGEDLEFMKRVSEKGFAPAWKEKLLSNIDELPAVENEAVKEALEDKNKKMDEEKSSEELEEPKAEEDNAIKFPEKTQELPKPEPVGKADESEMPLAASLRDKTMRRMSRMKEFKSIIQGG